MVDDMYQHTTGTDQDGVRRWLAADLKRRADRLGHTEADHLIVASFDACRRGRITAAAALMLAAENYRPGWCFLPASVVITVNGRSPDA